MEHSTSTSLWPQANTEVETFMKPLGKASATAQVEQHSWSQELSRFLLSYHTTPHSSTKVPPTQFLFSRQVRGKLAVVNTKSNVINRHRETRRNDAKQKQLAKQYPDTRRRTKPSGIKEGDTGLLQQREQNSHLGSAQHRTKVIAKNTNHRIL